jgi:hypothetical protein
MLCASAALACTLLQVCLSWLKSALAADGLERRAFAVDRVLHVTRWPVKSVMQACL